MNSLNLRILFLYFLISLSQNYQSILKGRVHFFEFDYLLSYYLKSRHIVRNSGC